MEREKLAGTGIGEGVALPHCRTGIVDEVIIAAGILDEPVEWESLDEKPVDIIFLIITPDSQPDAHLKVIKILSASLLEKEFKKRLQGRAVPISTVK
jgi:mannitol/fructose-specific phosphotransferase system IIA component (Ntr-type)